MHVALLLAKAVVVVTGLVIAYHGYKGYRRNDSRPMLFLAVGLGFVSIGSVCESVFYDVIGLSMFVSGMTQTAIVAIGMISILYALFGQMAV